MRTVCNDSSEKKQQSLWLFAAPILVLLILFAANAWANRDQNEIEMKIIFYPNTDLREKIAVKAISAAIKKHPQTNVYKVKMPGNGIYADGLLTYDRKQRRLTRKDVQPMGNGMISWWVNVRDASIHKAALKSASFDDMAKYGCRLMF